MDNKENPYWYKKDSGSDRPYRYARFETCAPDEIVRGEEVICTARA